MGMNAYLMFNGNCEEAMNFYAEATNGTIESLVRYSDTQMPCSEEYKNKIMHGIMLINGTKVMFSDASENRAIQFGDNFSLALDFQGEATMHVLFKGPSAGGIVTMPIQNTFWGAQFGMCKDKFGVSWMFNYDQSKDKTH